LSFCLPFFLPGCVSHSANEVSETPTLSINATSVAFGDEMLNMPATQSVTLTSIGTGPVTISAVTLTGTGFAVSGTAPPVALNPGQTATLNVQFDPIATGAVAGTLTITSNSSTNGTAVIGLSGTGLAPQVKLSWDAPSSSPDPVESYNIYRAPSGTNSYQQLNSSAVTQTTYLDSTVQSGSSYDYLVESVDASGVESEPSNMATITVN
jgi:hypothetical protein